MRPVLSTTGPPKFELLSSSVQRNSSLVNPNGLIHFDIVYLLAVFVLSDERIPRRSVLPVFYMLLASDFEGPNHIMMNALMTRATNTVTAGWLFLRGE